MDIAFVELLLVIQGVFIVMGFLIKAYIIPELLSTLIGLFLIQGLVNENIITVGTTDYLLTSYILVPIVLVTLFPLIYIVIRLTSRSGSTI